MWKGLSFLLFSISFFSIPSFGNDCEALKALSSNPHRAHLEQYALIGQLRHGNASASLDHFEPEVGIRVTARDAQGNPTQAKIRVLSDNSGNLISVVGDWNGWGQRMTSTDHLKPVPGTPYFEGSLNHLYDGMEYRLLLNGRQIVDPGANGYTTAEMKSRISDGKSVPYLNSVFYDLKSEGRTFIPPDLRGKPIIISEQGVHDLVAKFDDGTRVGPLTKADTYKWLAKTAPKLKEHGINVLEFLPVQGRIDGDPWYMAYQAYGSYSIDTSFGSPQEFRDAVMALKELGIGVVLDVVWGHYPSKGNVGVRELEPVGIHHFKNYYGKSLFGSDSTMWQTNRYDFSNPFVRRFLIESGLYLMKNYGVAGVRIDNVDGIRGYPGGNDFLREWSEALRRYRPEAISIAEMFSDQTPTLRDIDKGGQGIHLANDVEFFYAWVQKKLQANDEEINMNQLSSILRDPWRWNKAIMEYWITNHDEAANPQPGASGQYVATSIKGTNGSTPWFYVEQKTKAWGSLALCAGSASLSMLQMPLLQEGTLNTNSPVDWGLLKNESQRGVYDFFSHIQSAVRDLPAFAPQNLHPNIENHVDNNNKVISLLRLDHNTGKKYYVVINLGSKGVPNYNFGADGIPGSEYRVIVNSDKINYRGTGEFERRLGNAKILLNNNGNHGKPHSLTLPYLAPYEVLLLGEQDF